MDYGRRVYGTNSNNYITYMSEITDKYVQSIGGKFTAGIKQPYLYDDYFSMKYIYNLKKKYLGGTPAATLEDLGVTPVIVPEVSNLNTVFSVDFDGTYADSISGILPISTIGNNSLITHSGKSCVLFNNEGGGFSAIGWYPISTFNNKSFSLSWNSLGAAGCEVGCAIGVGDSLSYGSPGSIAAGFSQKGSVFVTCINNSGAKLIKYETPTSYFTDGVWHSFNVTLNNDMITVKFNNNIILTQELNISFLSNIIIIGIYSVNYTIPPNSVNAYFDSIKVENVIG